MQGSGIDEPINELGRQQAAAFFNAYGTHPFEKVFISNLQRTHQSVARFIEAGLPFEKLAGLNEISWGNREGSSFSLDTHHEYQRITEAWRSGDLDAAITYGESPNQVMARQREAMNVIINDPSQQILICMHGRAMRILMCWLLGYDLRHMDLFEHDNLGLYELMYTGRLFRLDKMNATEHLKSLQLQEQILHQA